MPKTSTKRSVNELTYEAAFSELEEVIAALESEQRSLDESMALYERGQALIKHCVKILDKAELRVKQLAGDILTDLEEAE
jgi:exodeoxyribonuclease VII small subunit